LLCNAVYMPHKRRSYTATCKISRDKEVVYVAGCLKVCVTSNLSVNYCYKRANSGDLFTPPLSVVGGRCPCADLLGSVITLGQMMHRRHEDVPKNRLLSRYEFADEHVLLPNA